MTSEIANEPPARMDIIKDSAAADPLCSNNSWVD